MPCGSRAGLLSPGDRIVDAASQREIPVASHARRLGGVRRPGRSVARLQDASRCFGGNRQPSRRRLPTPRRWKTASSAWPSIPRPARSRSIRDKQRNLELVDQAAPHRFNEYLYERFETSDWKAPTTWHRVRAATLNASAGPVAQVMRVMARPVGVDSLTQTVILYADLPRIDFTLDLVKSPSGRRDVRPNSDPRGKESLYVALPLAIADPQVRHELPGCVSEPVKDLFDGANTAFYAVQHFSDVSERPLWRDRFGDRQRPGRVRPSPIEPHHPGGRKARASSRKRKRRSPPDGCTST